MRTSALALAASALLMGAEAGSLLRRNAHANAHARLERRNGYVAPAPVAETCKIVTYTTWVEYSPPKTDYETTHTVQSTVYLHPTTSTAVPYTTVTPKYDHPVPTPEITTCPTPGTYTFPAKTITLTSTDYVCVPTSTVLPPGTHSYGYTTTVVATKTHVTCPYATTYTSKNTVYTTITSTDYECPTPGTYTYGGYKTTVTETKTITYPYVATYTPGTYTHPQSTVTVTATDVVYTCPYTAYSTPAHTPTKPATTYVAPPPPVVYTPTTKPAPKPTTSKPADHGVDYENVGKGKQWCITYTQYNDDKSCKAAGQIDADIKEIAAKGFKSIRVYAPDCDALTPISDACEKYGLKIVMGVFIRGSAGSWDKADVMKQIDTLKSWCKWNLVELVVIGNESVFGGIISSSDLAGLISECKAILQGAGYKGKVTTSEVVSTLEANPGLCAVIDVVAVNIQPFFNGGYASEAGPFIKSQMNQAYNVCKKTTYCLEAGWPAAGSPIGNAIPGVAEQKQAIDSIYGVDDGYIAYYTTYDDGWKDSSMNGGVEQHFGCAKLFPLGGKY